MRESERAAVARRVLELAGEAGCEAIVSSDRSGLTRFTRNAVHQNVASADTTVRVRTVADDRTGVASTNDLDDAGLRAVVERARASAALAPPDAVPTRFERAPHVASPASAYDAATADATPQDRAAIASGIIGAAESAGLWAAGYVTTAGEGVTIATSGGTLASYDGTSCGLNVKQNGPDATGFAERYGSAVRVLDGARSGAIAAEKARAGASPRAVDAGAWTVILEPAAVGELLAYLVDHFSARAYDEGSSFCSEGLGRTYVGENVTIGDDYAHPLLAGMPFDYEGTPTRRLPLVEAGVARHVVTDAFWSRKLGLENTGHALPSPNASGPEPRHVVVLGGEKPVEQLVAETKRGLLVSRFWYIRPVDVRRTIVTGMTRDGTFLIEDGAITGGVRNMRFNQSILDALRSCEFASEQIRTGGYSYSIVVPAVKIENFRFSSATEF